MVATDAKYKFMRFGVPPATCLDARLQALAAATLGWGDDRDPDDRPHPAPGTFGILAAGVAMRTRSGTGTHAATALAVPGPASIEPAPDFPRLTSHSR
jgi:hypothetical protein